MSRIGKQPVSIPTGVEIKLAESRITVKGPKGELVSSVPGETRISVEDNSIIVERTSDTKSGRALHGLTQKLIENMVRGVTSGYEKALEITGVGYRAQVQGSKIMLSLGYSHPVEFLLPEGIKAAVDQKQTKITLSGIDKQQVGQVAADLKKLRLPDVYKGKGIRYEGERIKLKVGKAGKK